MNVFPDVPGHHDKKQIVAGSEVSRTGLDKNSEYARKAFALGPNGLDPGEIGDDLDGRDRSSVPRGGLATPLCTRTMPTFSWKPGSF
jgi:hypothetical protein